MSKSIAAISALVAATLLASTAFAATQTKVGEVKSTDATKHELVLSSGETFELPQAFKIGSLKTGEKVKITYEAKDGKLVAERVQPAK